MSLDVQQIMLGVLIASLRRQFPPVSIENQILEGIRVAKKLSVLEGTTLDTLAISALIAKINIEAQTVGIYLQPEWAAKEGNDKNFSASGDDKTFGQSVAVSYTVTTGKQLYLVGASCSMVPATNTDYDHFLYIVVEVVSQVPGQSSIVVGKKGGLGGSELQFARSVVIPSTNILGVFAYNYSNITCDLVVTAWGYEI